MTIVANRKDMTAAYYKALDLPKSAVATDAYVTAKMAALDRAHEMRKFEIENYWKRATYFWSFQAIAFALLGFMFGGENGAPSLMAIQLPAAIGAISGFVGWLSAKGSKYWQENWESHVDALEGDVEGKLTQTIWNDGKVNHSVSRLNQRFMGLVTGGWIAAMTAPFIAGHIPDWIVQASPEGFFCLLMAILIYIWIGTKQTMTGYVLHQDSWIEVKPGWRWIWKRQGDGKEERQLLLRHTKAKDAVIPDEG
ncbi:hypothetical protein D0Z70_09165 [Sphingobium terrigena]|uniref:Uncharacterized protein n=1 Tax=Sphingobium terrigena TaxID=2304063 RepID=A0A418YU17_9SPHN|nr:hypothetical protein [Sphingobium terrigena]RJG55556.1 hypothetical protein D0Z70_09165 [Sphingobium terrigena]